MPTSPNTPYTGLIEKIKNFIIPKVKFATTSAVATVVDYSLYLILVAYSFNPVIANIIAAGCGMLINFLLQKRFIFTLERRTSAAFAWSITFSLIGIGLSTTLIFLLNKITFFQQYQFITKLIAVGLIFLYNFYTKRFAFERKLW